MFLKMNFILIFTTDGGSTIPTKLLTESHNFFKLFGKLPNSRKKLYCSAINAGKKIHFDKTKQKLCLSFYIGRMKKKLYYSDNQGTDSLISFVKEML